MIIWLSVVLNRTVVAVADPHLQIRGGGGGGGPPPPRKGGGGGGGAVIQTLS